MTDRTGPTIEALRELGSEFSRVDGAKSRHAAVTRKGLAIAVVAILLALSAFSLTPPGRAAADWLGERFGIGEPGGSPTLKEFREFATEGTIADGVRAYVVARGPTPYGGHFELLTFESNADGSRCFELDILDERGRVVGTGGGTCERAGAPARGAGAAAQPLPESGGLRVDSTGASILPDRELADIVGRVSDDVAAVEVEFNGQSLETQLITVSEALAEEVGIPNGFKVYAAFSTEARRGRRIEITAIGEGGEVLAQTQRSVPSIEAALVFSCETMREDAARGAGEITPRQAEQFCRDNGVAEIAERP